MVGLAGSHAAFLAVGFVCNPVESARIPVHVRDVAVGEWLQLLVMVPEASVVSAEVSLFSVFFRGFVP